MGQSPVAGGWVGKLGPGKAKQRLGRRRNKTDLCHYLGFHPLMEVALHRLSITPPKSTEKCQHWSTPTDEYQGNISNLSSVKFSRLNP